MASYSITVRNDLSIYGGSSVNKWGEMVWQEAASAGLINLWGYTDDITLFIRKGISTSFGLDSDVNKTVKKVISESLVLDDSVGKSLSKKVSIDLDLTSTVATVEKRNMQWKYVYPNNTTNLMDRFNPEWDSQTITTATSWAVATMPSTTWS